MFGAREKLPGYSQVLVENARKASFWLSLIGIPGIGYMSFASAEDLLAR